MYLFIDVFISVLFIYLFVQEPWIQIYLGKDKQ